MPIEKIGNLTNIISAHAKMMTNAKRQSNLQQESTHGDVVYIENSEGISEAMKVHYPPMFPIGDTQSIFKTNK